jgi:ABC-2 type transport system ATP-binding protein
MENVIEVTGLQKSFGRARALDGIDLAVRAGEVHGFLGPNGAGKTTTIRVLLGLIRADAGSVRLLGGDVWRDAARLHRRLAYVPTDVTIWPGLSGGEVIDLLGRVHGGLDPERRARLLGRFELDPTKKGHAYSKGDRQKIALVAAFASGAELLILDEPASGLGPAIKTVFRDCVREARGDGRTVLLSSHLLPDVEALCDRMSIIRDGRTVRSGALGELRRMITTSIDAELADPGALAGLAELPGVHGLDVQQTRVHCDVEAAALGETLRRLAASGVRSLISQPLTLEELFRRHDPAAGGESQPTADAQGVPA